ncbi:MAG: hypothetical protein JO170_05970 [Verrucomicrobia bacterium]|nr:hypothetical protein [Verrucomicrobiota bacterium]
MPRYEESARDPYVDEGTGILKNLLGCRTEEELSLKERELSYLRQTELWLHPIEPTFDLAHLRQPSPIWQSGRPVHRPFRGLYGVHCVTACTLALPPYVVARLPKASTVSLPPQLLRLLPAGAVAGWGLHPLEKRRLFTAHARSGRCHIGPSICRAQ